MREQIARLVCVLSLALVIALALVFAVRHNSPVPSPPPPVAPDHTHQRSTAASSAQIARGKALFTDLECASCHSFRGQGSPRRPLDDISSQRSPAELSAWITGTGVAASSLSPAVLRRKERYQSLSPDDLSALVVFLISPALENEIP